MTAGEKKRRIKKEKKNTWIGEREIGIVDREIKEFTSISSSNVYCRQKQMSRH